MNNFANMAASLARVPAAPWGQALVASKKGVSRTEAIRQLLRASTRSLTAAEIAFDMEDFPNFGSHLVWLLLKYDIQKGRVVMEDGLYRWNHDYDTAEAEAVRKAVKLLIKRGYKVVEPQTQ